MENGTSSEQRRLLHAAEVSQREGDRHRALEFYEEAMGLSPLAQKAWRGIRATRAESGLWIRNAPSQDTFWLPSGRVEELQKIPLDTLKILVRKSYEAGYLDEAILQQQEVCRRVPGDSTGLKLLGSLEIKRVNRVKKLIYYGEGLRRRGLLEKALESWYKAYALHRGNPRVRSLINETEAMLEQNFMVPPTDSGKGLVELCRAEEDFDQFSERWKSYDQLLVQAGQQKKKGRLANAEVSLLHARILMPQRQEAILALARLEKSSRKSKPQKQKYAEQRKAIRQVEDLLEIDAFAEAAQIALPLTGSDPLDKRVKELRRKIDKAQKKSLQSNKKGKPQKEFLAGIQAYRDKDYQKALKLWKQALKNDPGNRRILKYIQSVEGKLRL